MQLKNRLVKADFWTDTGLAKELPAMGRMMYQGLWQLAEDSGIIEADPLAYKMLLFPLDNIEIDKIEKWTKTLVELGKLIPYKVGKNEYYYIKNFHKHQSLRSPAKPELPLPGWVIYVSNKKKRQSGGYIIDYDLMPETEEINGTVTVGNVNQSVLDDYAERKATEDKPYDDSKEGERKPKEDRTESVRSSNDQATVTNKNVNEKENKNMNKNMNKNNKKHSSDSESPNDDQDNLGEEKADPKNNKPKFDANSKPYKAACYLREKILENNKRTNVPNKDPADLEDWVVELDRLNRLGPVGAKESEGKGYNWEEIAKLIQWCQQDNFWKSNILSAGKLREKVVTLENQMKSRSSPKGVDDDDEENRSKSREVDAGHLGKDEGARLEKKAKKLLKLNAQ